MSNGPKGSSRSLRSAPARAAQQAGLKHVSDESPGITRRRNGQGFVYLDRRGRQIRDSETLLRIQSLAIPPAWREVWICPDPRGHLQAVGRDARGRKQYRYHDDWRVERDAEKYGRMIEFARVLPRIRRRARRDLARRGLPREKVLAAIVILLEASHVRIGNDEYARHNGSYGLTTLLDRHVHVNGKKLHIEFRGKSGIEHAIDVNNPQLAHIAKACQELPGQELFEYVDEAGGVHDVGSGDVNDYIRAISGQDFTAKDFRTWAGTVMAAATLCQFEPFTSKAQAKRNLLRAIDEVASSLGNTRAVCRRCYIHPGIMEAYLSGILEAQLSSAPKAPPPRGLRPGEKQVLTMLARTTGRVNHVTQPSGQTRQSPPSRKQKSARSRQRR